MVKNSKAKSRLDKFYHLAKEHGFRSRAAFKLIQLNKKYNFFSECRTVLDLCAAPGGWMQVAAKHVPISSLIIGVDLIPIRPIRGTQSIVGDITSEKCTRLIEKTSKSQLFDIVLNDGSPNVGGAWHSESLSQAMLVLDALKLATKFLAPNGWFITKVFRSKDYNALLYVCNQLFGKVEATKPTASRNSSAEIFLVCWGYKAPECVDPKLLDARHVLQDFSDASGGKIRGPLVLQKKQPKKLQRRFREGYETNASTTFKSASIVEFINAQDPVEVLGLYTQFHFNPMDSELDQYLKQILNHPKTTPMIKELCQDLLILGRKEFKMLLKWRSSMSKELKQESKCEQEPPKESLEDDPESRMMKELSEIQDRLHQKAKKKEKKLRAMKKHAKQRLVQFQQSEGITDQIVDEKLFSLDDQNLSQISSTNSEEEYVEQEDDDESNDEKSKDERTVDPDVYEASYLEESYERFLRRRGQPMTETPQLKRRLRLDDSHGALANVDDEELEIQEVDLPQSTSQAITSQWFDQDIFQSMELDSAPQESAEEPHESIEEAEASQENEEEDEEEEEFEIVKGQESDSEILAMARKLLHRKEKENLTDAAYSRFVFHDTNLPKWFEHDNDIYNRPQRMVTREEIEAEKEMLRAMSCRPIKKIAEAKSRKAKRMAQRMKQAMKRAEGISNQEELSHGTKMRQITKMMNQARKKENGRFVSKDKFKKLGRSKQIKIQNRMPRLDKRLKSDKRQRGIGRGGKNRKIFKQKKSLAKQKYKQRHNAK
eukprot:g4416.t1